MKKNVCRSVGSDGLEHRIELRHVRLPLIEKAPKGRHPSVKSSPCLVPHVDLKRGKDSEMNMGVNDARNDVFAGNVHFLGADSLTPFMDRGDFASGDADIPLEHSLAWPDDCPVSQDYVISARRFFSRLGEEFRGNPGSGGGDGLERMGWSGLGRSGGSPLGRQIASLPLGRRTLNDLNPQFFSHFPGHSRNNIVSIDVENSLPGEGENFQIRGGDKSPHRP